MTELETVDVVTGRQYDPWGTEVSPGEYGTSVTVTSTEAKRYKEEQAKQQAAGIKPGEPGWRVGEGAQARYFKQEAEARAYQEAEQRKQAQAAVQAQAVMFPHERATAEQRALPIQLYTGGTPQYIQTSKGLVRIPTGYTPSGYARQMAGDQRPPETIAELRTSLHEQQLKKALQPRTPEEIAAELRGAGVEVSGTSKRIAQFTGEKQKQFEDIAGELEAKQPTSLVGMAAPYITRSAGRLIGFAGMVPATAEVMAKTAYTKPFALPEMLDVGTRQFVGGIVESARTEPIQLGSDILVSSVAFGAVAKPAARGIASIKEPTIKLPESQALPGLMVAVYRKGGRGEPSLFGKSPTARQMAEARGEVWVPRIKDAGVEMTRKEVLHDIKAQQTGAVTIKAEHQQLKQIQELQPEQIVGVKMEPIPKHETQIDVYFRELQKYRESAGVEFAELMRRTGKTRQQLIEEARLATEIRMAQYYKSKGLQNPAEVVAMKMEQRLHPEATTLSIPHLINQIKSTPIGIVGVKQISGIVPIVIQTSSAKEEEVSPQVQIQKFEDVTETIQKSKTLGVTITKTEPLQITKQKERGEEILVTPQIQVSIPTTTTPEIYKSISDLAKEEVITPETPKESQAFPDTGLDDFTRKPRKERKPEKMEEKLKDIVVLKEGKAKKEKEKRKEFWYPSSLEAVTAEEFGLGGKRAKHFPKKEKKVTKQLLTRWQRTGMGIPTPKQLKKKRK